MGYLDSAEDLFRDIDAIKNRQKFQEALKVQTRRNATDEVKIRNYDLVLAQRDAILKEQLEGFDWALGILDTIFEDLIKNGLDSESEVVPKDPDKARAFALKRKAIGLIKAQADVHYTNEFKVELEERFRQEYQKQVDRIIETKRTAHSGMPEEKERAVKDLVQKIQASYPRDVFKSLQGSWRIWCDECFGAHLQFLTADNVTALLRRSSIKMDTENRLCYRPGLYTPIPSARPHFQEIHLATMVRAYIASRLEAEQK